MKRKLMILLFGLLLTKVIFARSAFMCQSKVYPDMRINEVSESIEFEVDFMAQINYIYSPLIGQRFYFNFVSNYGGISLKVFDTVAKTFQYKKLKYEDFSHLINIPLEREINWVEQIERLAKSPAALNDFDPYSTQVSLNCKIISK